MKKKRRRRRPIFAAGICFHAKMKDGIFVYATVCVGEREGGREEIPQKRAFD